MDIQEEIYDEGIRYAALFDYLAGYSMDFIANKYKVHISLVTSWSISYSWDAARQEFAKRVRETIFDKLMKKVEESTERFLEVGRVVSQMTVEVVQKAYVEGIHREGNQDIHKWMKTLQIVSNIQKNAMPLANEDLAEQLVTDASKGVTDVLQDHS